MDTYWSFASYEYAGDPQGSYLELRDKGTLLVRRDVHLEITAAKGSLRILPLADIAKSRPDGSWLLGSDNKTLYGDSPWTFEAREGITENKGLHLIYQEKDVFMTGRETLRVEVHDLKTLLSGSLGDIGSWKRGAWTIDMAKITR